VKKIYKQAVRFV